MKSRQKLSSEEKLHPEGKPSSIPRLTRALHQSRLFSDVSASKHVGHAPYHGEHPACDISFGGGSVGIGGGATVLHCQ